MEPTYNKTEPEVTGLPTATWIIVHMCIYWLLSTAVPSAQQQCQAFACGGSPCAEAREAPSFYQQGSSLLLRHQVEHDPTANQEGTLLIMFEEFRLIHFGAIGGVSSSSPLEHTPKQNSCIWLDTSHVLQLQAFPHSKNACLLSLCSK